MAFIMIVAVSTKMICSNVRVVKTRFNIAIVMLPMGPSYRRPEEHCQQFKFGSTEEQGEVSGSTPG